MTIQIQRELCFHSHDTVKNGFKFTSLETMIS